MQARKEDEMLGCHATRRARQDVDVAVRYGNAVRYGTTRWLLERDGLHICMIRLGRVRRQAGPALGHGRWGGGPGPRREGAHDVVHIHTNAQQKNGKKNEMG